MIEEPLWLRAAAVVAALAGLEPELAVEGFDTDAAGSIARTLGSFRAAGSRGAVAQAIGRERFAVVARNTVAAPAANLAALGAYVAASLLRSLPASERAALARSLDPALLRRAAELAATAPMGEATSLVRTVASAADVLGRMPTADELGQVASAALGRGQARARAFVHATLRRSRARGVATSQAFAPFAALLE